jgi:hypothetical protein
MRLSLDGARNQIVLFGGDYDYVYFNYAYVVHRALGDTWVWEGINWSSKK